MARIEYRTMLEQWKRELSAELGKDITYEDIAEDSKVSISALNKHVSHGFRRPDYATAAKICAYFNNKSARKDRTPLDYFVETSVSDEQVMARQTA